MSFEIVFTTFLYKDTNGIPHGGSIQDKPFVPFLSGNSIVKAEKTASGRYCWIFLPEFLLYQQGKQAFPFSC